MLHQQELHLANKYFEEANALNEEGKYEDAIKRYKKAAIIYEKRKEWEGWMKANDRVLGIYNKEMLHKQGIAYFQKILKTGKNI